MKKREKIAAVMKIVERYGSIDGAHHKDWCLDQIARIIKGDQYEEWVVDMQNGEDGPETYSYDEGIAP
jgi:hypothetical protein